MGSLSAALVALYVAHSFQKTKLRGRCSHSHIIGANQFPISVFSVSVTNISQRPTVITLIKDRLNHGIPFALSDGETGNWCVPLGNENAWLKEIAKDFSINAWAVFTWRVQVHTSNGGTTSIRPEKSIREILLASAA